MMDEIQIAASVLLSYLAEYEFEPGASIAITLDDGQLFAQLDAQPKTPVFAESPMEFFLPAANARISFIRDRTRLVTGLILQQRGGIQNLAWRRW
jgi:hypothetical protein